MKRRLLLISLIMAALAATLVFMYLQSLDKPKEETVKVKIYVAAATIQERTMVEAKMVKQIEVPDSEMVQKYIKDIKQIVGKYAKSTIETGEGFLASKLMGKEESTNEITVKIAKNHRAVSIAVNGESGISKLVKPGDFVDVFVFLAAKTSGQQAVRPDLARMILQNMEVLAIDKKLVREGSMVEDTKDSADSKTEGSFLVTLSVPVDEVGKLVLAEDIGSLKLALRSGEKEKPYVPKTITEEELFSLDSSKNSSATATPKPVKSTSENPTGKDSSDKTATSYQEYIVQPGDTLMSLSRKFYGNKQDYILIKQENNIGDDNLLRSGVTIRIPIKQH